MLKLFDRDTLITLFFGTYFNMNFRRYTKSKKEILHPEKSIGI